MNTASRIHDVGAGSAGGHGINHRAAICVLGSVCLGIVKAGKLRADALGAATANSGKAGGIGEAIQFVGSGLLDHFRLQRCVAPSLAHATQNKRGKAT